MSNLIPESAATGAYFDMTQSFVIAVPIAGIIMALNLWRQVRSVDIFTRHPTIAPSCLRTLLRAFTTVREAASAFLVADYQVASKELIIIGCGMWIFLGLSEMGSHAAPWLDASLTTVCFWTGGASCLFAGYVGMRVAVNTNVRATIKATSVNSSLDNSRRVLEEVFNLVFKGGLTLGYAVSSLAILGLLFNLFLCTHLLLPGKNLVKMRQVYDCVVAYGFGASIVACLTRIGGGIFAKAADVAVNLVTDDVPEDDTRNPAFIADCVGGNVGGVSAMGSDIFSSFAQAACAALLVSSFSAELSTYPASLFPFVIPCCGLIAVAVTGIYARLFMNMNIKVPSDVAKILKRKQLVASVASCVLITIAVMLVLPDHFTLVIHKTTNATKWHALACVLLGVWCGWFIGYSVELLTGADRESALEVVEASRTGAATNIIYGLAIGFRSVVPLVIAIAVTIYVCHQSASLYGYALCGLGVLSTMVIQLSISAFGAITDNAHAFAEVAGLRPETLYITGALDAPRDTTAALAKGFAIASAAFAALANYGAFVSRAEMAEVNVLDVRVLFGLVYGAMIPYVFASILIKSVGHTAIDLVDRIHRQLNDPKVADGSRDPDHVRVIDQCHQESNKQMQSAVWIIFLSPILFALIFGKYALAGMLQGAFVSGVLIAFSSCNTGALWKTALRYVEAEEKALKHADEIEMTSTTAVPIKADISISGSHTSALRAAVMVGDSVGDALKDASGPAQNVLIKYMIMPAVIMTPLMKHDDGLLGLIKTSL